MIQNRMFLMLLCGIFWIGNSNANAQSADTAKSQKSSGSFVSKPKNDVVTVHQLRVGFDIGRFLFNNLYPSRKGYEIQFDYNWKGKLYLAAETGWGQGNVDYSFLQYKTQGEFIRLGIQQSLLGQNSPKDFDNAFIGVRYAMGIGEIGDANFTVPSPFGGTTAGVAPGQNYFVHWGEIVGGLEVAIWRHFYAGWMARGKFLINPHTFKQLSPNYIPGYGKGDKNSIFDFNFYISYGIQWTKNSRRNKHPS